MFNNPVSFSDPDGDLPILIPILAGVIGGGLNVWNKWDHIKEGGFSAGLKAFGVGFVAGAVGTLATPAAAVGATLSATIGSYAYAGAVGGLVTGGIEGFGNSLFFSDGDYIDHIGNGLLHDVFGAAGGAAIGGAFGSIAHGLKSLKSFLTNASGGGNTIKLGETLDDGVGLSEEIVVTPGNATKGGTSGLSKKISVQKQARHIAGTAKPGGGFLDNIHDAQAVLDAVHSGEATFLGTSKAGHLVYRFNPVTGTNVNLGAGITGQPTNVFMIKGTVKPSVVPTSPFWKR